MKHSEQLDKSLFFAWIFLLGLVFLSYAPGLSGGFIFDDYPNIVNDKNIILQNFSWEELQRVAESGSAGPLKRPVAVVSLAVQIAATGMEPWFFKLGNIFIHLLAALALGLLVSRLLSVWGQKVDAPLSLSPQQIAYAAWAAWLAVALWSLHPLNLTSVLYIVQRMTSLAALFGFLATAAFIKFRTETAFACKESRAKKFVFLKIFPVILFLLLSVYSKENGILFIGLIGLIEFFVFQFRWMGRNIYIQNCSLHRLANYFSFIIFFAVIFYSLPKILDNTRIYFRDFSTPERFLTQMRVLVFYLGEFFVPVISKMSLYHDDIEISKSFTQPISTLWSFIFLLLITAAAVIARKKQPIILFSWLWFLISHSLESTIFPLELVHEHRNYFAMVGFCIAIAFWVQKLMPLYRSKVFLGFGFILVFFGVSTAARSYEWHHPLIFSKMEALRHPLSVRAHYQLGRDLLFVYGENPENKAILVEAELAFQQASRGQSDSVAPYFGLLFMQFLKPEDEKEAIALLVKTLVTKLKTSSFEASHASYVNSLMECQLAKKCRLNDYDMLVIITSGVENPSVPRLVKSELLKIAAQYAVSQANDWAYAKRLLEEAVKFHDSVSTRIVFSQILRNRGELDLAEEQIEMAQKLNNSRVYKTAIANEKAKLAAAKLIQ